MDQETPSLEFFYEREIEEQRQKDRYRREMDAYTQAERGRSEMIENDLPFGAFLALHNELSNKGPKGNAKMHAKDFDTYGDPNLRSSKGAGKKLPGGGKRSRRGTGAMQVNRLLTNEGTPSLDAEIEAINDRLGTDFTPQDAIDYIMDRANNPGKYTAENVNLAERIEAEGPDAVLGPIQIDVEEATTEAAPAVTEEVTTTPATEKQKAGYNKRIEKGIKDANKATTTKEKAAALQYIITNTTAIQERHGESFVTDEQQAEIDRLTQELADEGVQISEDVQIGKETIVGQIIDIDSRKEDDTLPIGTTVIERVVTPELVDSEGNLVQRGKDVEVEQESLLKLKLMLRLQK